MSHGELGTEHTADPKSYLEIMNPVVRQKFSGNLNELDLGIWPMFLVPENVSKECL